MMLLFSLGNTWILTSPPVPVQHKWYFMGLVKQVKMQLQLCPDSLAEASFHGVPWHTSYPTGHSLWKIMAFGQIMPPDMQADLKFYLIFRIEVYKTAVFNDCMYSHLGVAPK